MKEANLLVRRIKDGTVIDHINKGKGLYVLNALDIDGKDGNVITIALNVKSKKFDKKDIIKVENKFLKEDDTNMLAVIVPEATVNIIKNFNLVEKRHLTLPDQIIRIFACGNPNCITNSNENIETVMNVIDKKILQCKYCKRVLDINKLLYE